MEYVSGHILTEQGFQKGYLCIKDHCVIEQKTGLPPKTPFQSGLIVPTFVNMHTHVGDAFIRRKKIPLPRDILQLVAPPDGLKHKLLEKTSNEEIVDGMKRTLQEMNETGTISFFDFRENGIQGIHLLKKAIENISITGRILARPQTLTFDKNEILQLLQHSDGIGLSSLSDWDIDPLTEIASLTQKEGKIFALHASERIRENIDIVLDLQPTFLVHMNKATQTDLEKIKKRNVPLVLCPRSNTFFNLKIPLALLKKVGNTVLLGTDNAMLHDASLLLEIKHILQYYPNIYSLEEVLFMVTYAPRKALNLKDGIPHLAFPASFLVLNEQTLELVYRFY